MATKIDTEPSQKARDLLAKIHKSCLKKTASIKKAGESKYSERSEAVRDIIQKIGRSEKELVSLMEEVMEEPIRPLNSEISEHFKKFSVIVELKENKKSFMLVVGNPIIFLSDSSSSNGNYRSHNPLPKRRRHQGHLQCCVW